MNKKAISKILNSGNMNQRMILLSEEIARAKYGNDKLLTDYEFNSLNDSFQGKYEKELYQRYQEADKIADRALVNLQGLSFKIRLNNSNLKSYMLLSFNISQTENIVNMILSNIDNQKKRKNVAKRCVNFCGLSFSDCSVDDYGFVDFKLNSKNKKVNLQDLIGETNKSLEYNIKQFKSWKTSLMDYLKSNGIVIKTYNEIIQKLTDSVNSTTTTLSYNEIKIDNNQYDWFLKNVLVE